MISDRSVRIIAEVDRDREDDGEYTVPSDDDSQDGMHQVPSSPFPPGDLPSYQSQSTSFLASPPSRSSSVAARFSSIGLNRDSSVSSSCSSSTASTASTAVSSAVSVETAASSKRRKIDSYIESISDSLHYDRELEGRRYKLELEMRLEDRERERQSQERREEREREDRRLMLEREERREREREQEKREQRERDREHDLRMLALFQTLTGKRSLGDDPV